MRHWKKMLVLAAIAMLAFGAIAYAHGGWGYGSMMEMGGYGYMMRPMMQGGQSYRACDGPGFRGQTKSGGWEVAPAEIQNSMKELQRAQLELRLALTKEPVDSKKVTELHEKVLNLHNEMARWHFDQILKEIAEGKSSD